MDRAERSKPWEFDVGPADVLPAALLAANLVQSARLFDALVPILEELTGTIVLHRLAAKPELRRAHLVARTIAPEEGLA